eukprot:Hpha_TRINITY_DN16570_c1_g1::TRINITY_DN16570_c1_g1_i1::g.132295::m.132295
MAAGTPCEYATVEEGWVPGTVVAFSPGGVRGQGLYAIRDERRGSIFNNWPAEHVRARSANASRGAVKRGDPLPPDGQPSAKRMAGSVPGMIAPGTSIQAQFDDGQWYPGKIKAVHANTRTYDVTWEGENTYTDGLPEASVRRA